MRETETIRNVIAFASLGLLLLVAACAAPGSVSQRRTDVPASPSSGSSGDRADAGTDETEPREGGNKQETVRVVLKTGKSPLGAYSLLLQFDPRQAELDDVSAPSGNDFQSPFHKLLDPDDTSVSVLRIASFQIDRAPSGTVPVAVVTFVSDASPSSFIRDLRLETASDPSGRAITPTATWQRHPPDDPSGK